MTPLGARELIELRLIYTSEITGDGAGWRNVRALMLMCKTNEGDGCVKEAKRKVSFIITSPSPLTLLTSSVNRLNGNGNGDVTNQPVKILEKYKSNVKKEINKINYN